jgi:hypothetical protein
VSTTVNRPKTQWRTCALSLVDSASTATAHGRARNEKFDKRIGARRFGPYQVRYTSTTYNNLYSDVILIHGDVILNYGDVKACSTPGNSRLASKKANRGDVRTVRFPPLSIAFGFGFQKLKGADVARSHHRMLPNALSDRRHGVPRDIMNLGHEHVSFLHSSADVDVFEPRIEII